MASASGRKPQRRRTAQIRRSSQPTEVSTMPTTSLPRIPSGPHAAAPLAGRRRLLLAWPLAALTGCAAPWPAVPAGPGSASALARLRESADAHGLAGWRALHDVNLGFDHLPWPAARDLKPTGAAQMRLRPADGTAVLHADSQAPGATPLATSLCMACCGRCASPRRAAAAWSAPRRRRPGH
jgi:hypothetical protein